MKTTLTSENPANLKVINQTEADMIIRNIMTELRVWKIKNYLYHSLIGVLGTVAILGSVIVSVYLDTRSEILTAERLKLIAIASTVSLSILSAFNVISKTNNYISACDLMQVALFKYNARLIGLGTLIEAYDKANKIIGGIDFNFDKNFNPANGKTVVSVDTEEEVQVRENQSSTLAPAAGQSGGKPDVSAAKAVRRSSEKAAAEPGEINFLRDATKPSVPEAAYAPEPVKSEAIINTDDVSVLVSEK